MNFNHLNKFEKNFFLGKRLVFQGVDKAPPSPENFQNKEKQVSAAEVASQSPSQIFNDTVSAGAVIATKYKQGTTTLVNLVNDDPVFTGQGFTTTTTTTATTNTTTTTKTNVKQKN